jgi:hypothetical protein
MNPPIRLFLVFCLFLSVTIQPASAGDTSTRATSQIHIKARFMEVPKKVLASATFFTNAVAGPMTGIMSDSSFRALIHALQNQPGVETIAEPEVVTVSGRQTRMRCADMDSGYPLLAQNGTPSFNKSPVANPQVAGPESGPSIDIIPSVLADGSTINLAATLSAGHSSTSTVTVNLWDNQTLALGNFPNVATTGKNADRQILVLVTATIVDPAGNRVHSDDELPFNPSTIPPQPGTRP